MSGESFVADMNRRLELMETAVGAQPDGNLTLNLVRTVKAQVKTLEEKISKSVTAEEIELTLEAKMKTMIFMSDKMRSSNEFFKKPILESKAVSDVKKLSDAKSY